MGVRGFKYSMCGGTGMGIEGFVVYGGVWMCGHGLTWVWIALGRYAVTRTDLEGLEWAWNVWDGYGGSGVGKESLGLFWRSLGVCEGPETGVKGFRWVWRVPGPLHPALTHYIHPGPPTHPSQPITTHLRSPYHPKPSILLPCPPHLPKAL